MDNNSELMRSENNSYSQNPNGKQVKYAKPHYNLGKALAKKGEWEGAIAHYQKAMELAPHWEEVRQSLADAQNKLQEKNVNDRGEKEAGGKSTMPHYKLGKMLAKQGEWQEAIACYRKSIEVEPHFADVYHSLGDALVETGEKDEAIRVYQRAIEIEPLLWEVYHKLGNLLSEIEELDEAVAAYNKSIDLKSDFCWSYNNLGDVLVKLERWQEAAGAYRQAVELNPDFPWGHYKLGDVLVELEDWEGAIAAYHKAIKLKPDLTGVHTRLADALHRQARLALKYVVNYYRQAIEENPDYFENYHKILEIIPDDYQANLQLAKAWERKGDLFQAIVFCKNAIASDSKKVEGHLFLGNLWVKLHNLGKACDSYRRAVGLAPNRWEYHQKLGETLEKMGKPDEAIAAYEKAIEIEPNAVNIKQSLAQLLPKLSQQGDKKELEARIKSAQNYRNLGDKRLKEGKLEEAASNFYLALELNPDLWQAHHSLGDALQKQASLEEAIACYRRAININPNFFWSHYNLGNTLAQKGNLDEAITSYFNAAEVIPYKTDAYKKLAYLLQKQGKIDEAEAYKLLVRELTDNPVKTCCDLGNKLALEGKIERAIACYKRAVELKQDLWEAYGKLGELLREKGDIEEEIKLYKRVLKLNPDLSEIELRLQEALKEQQKRKRVKVEGIPDDFVIPPIVGEGNDYSFIEEKVKEFVENKQPYKLPVSIVIPTYNRKEILAKTLAAITHQTYPKHLIEVIVADDGSTDGVEEVVLKYEEYLELIHVRQQDRGYRLCAVRNLGIRTSKHEHLILLDCDLIPEPQFVEELMKYLHVTDKAVLMAHRRFVSTDGITDDEIFDNINIALGLEDIVTENVMFKSDLKNKATIDWRFQIYEKTDNLKKEKYPFRAFASGHVAYSKNILDKVGWYDEDFQEWGCEDIEFGYRVYNAGYYFIPVLTAIDLHQEPPGGSNETDRISGKQITQKLLEQKCPAGWYRKYRLGEIYEVPKVSIYIPAYNVEDFINHTVDSVLNQTYTDLEVCICDDGSTDKTLKVLEENYSENPRVRWVSQANGGIGKASNIAVKMCRGMYVGQLDSDDMLKPDAVETMVKYLDEHDVGCVYSSCERIDKYGNYVKDEYNWPEFSREKMMITMIVHHFRMFRKRDWMRTEGFAEDLLNAVDYDLYMKLSEVCSFHHINRVTYSRRIHGQNTSLLYEKEQDSNTIIVINRSLERLGLSDLWTIEQKNPNNPRTLEICRQKIGSQNL